MKNEKLVTFAYFVENHLIERVWFARHVTANVQHMVESFIKNYRRLVFVLGVAKTCCMVTKKAHAVEREKQTQDIALAHFAEKQ